MYISDVSSVQFKMYIVQVKQEKIYVSPKLLVRRTCWSSETYTFFLSVVGDLIPAKRSEWKVYRKLREIMSIVQ